MKLFEFRNWLLPVLLVSFIGPALPFLPEGFLISVRWGVVAMVALFFLVDGKSLGLLHRSIVLTTVLYVSWCLLTYSWSLVPSISLMKGAAQGGVILSFLLAGYDWVRRLGVNESLSFSWLYAVVSLAAAFSGGALIQPVADSTYVLYEGATGNPNMLGAMMASSTPVIIWYLYRDRLDRKRRLLWGALLAACIVALYWTISRSAYVIFLGIVAGVLLAHGMKRSIALALVGTVIAGLTVFVAPDLTESFVHRNVYKYHEDQGVFYARDQPWEDSYHAATEGAWIGLGYGVSIGEHNFNVGPSALGYGREKGNSQFAIVEETGMVGLIFYAAILFALFPELLGAFRACRIAQHRMMMGLLIGTLLGMLLQSVFEAWWVAPGAPEFAYFWAVAGAALGAARMIQNQSVAQAVRASPALYPVST